MSRAEASGARLARECCGERLCGRVALTDQSEGEGRGGGDIARLQRRLRGQ